MARRKKKEEESKVGEQEMLLQAEALHQEIFALRNELAMNRKLEKPHLLKQKRHERARVLTLITQEQRRARG